jgi:hypothetical protein
VKTVPIEIVALTLLLLLGLGTWLIVGSLLNIAAGLGAGLIVVTTLLLLYIVLPDRGAAE